MNNLKSTFYEFSKGQASKRRFHYVLGKIWFDFIILMLRLQLC